MAQDFCTILDVHVCWYRSHKGLYWWKSAYYCALFETCNRCVHLYSYNAALMCDYTRVSWSHKHTPVIVYQSLCGNVSKSLKKYRLFGCSSVHINITEENNMQSHAHLCGTEAMLRYHTQSGVKDSFLSCLTNQFKVLAKQWKICHLFSDSRSVSLS